MRLSKRDRLAFMLLECILLYKKDLLATKYNGCGVLKFSTRRLKDLLYTCKGVRVRPCSEIGLALRRLEEYGLIRILEVRLQRNRTAKGIYRVVLLSSR